MQVAYVGLAAAFIAYQIANQSTTSGSLGDM